MVIDTVKTIEDRGFLSVLEFNDLPFIPKRVFWVYSVSPREIRGGHAHRETEQYLICVQGAVMVRLWNGKNRDERIISQGDAVFVPKMIWDEQVFLGRDSILLVLASTPYDKADYIENMEEYNKCAVS